MESSPLRDDNDIQAMRELLARLASRSTVVDFEEQILLPSIRKTTRIWRQNHQIIGFAFVDEYNNLWFETEAEFDSVENLESEMIEWGTTCLQSQVTKPGSDITVDCTCNADDSHRLNVLRKHGFTPEQVRSLRYSHFLNEPVTQYPLPPGFSVRCVNGKEEVEKLVALHQASFGSSNMTVEYRLAMMNTPQYRKELDLVVVTANDQLAAFCVCGFDDPEKKIGYTDPIGTHPSYQRQGLARAILSAGLITLKNAGAQTVRLGTSSENVTMQKLATDLRFVCVSEKLWFSKAIL